MDPPRAARAGRGRARTEAQPGRTPREGPGLLGVALALASSASWGVADFLGGLQSRRISTLAVLLVSQPIGLALAVAFALAVGGDPLRPPEVAAAAGAGAAVVLALGAFYRGMALGSVSVVAMIGALGVLVPVAVGLARGEDPTAVQIAGAAAAISGVALVTRHGDREWQAATRRATGLAALAALGFGVFFVGIDASAGDRPAWTIVAARTGGVASLLVVAAAVRPAIRVPRQSLPTLAVIGACDVLANSLFALATTRGLLSLVSVAGSLYSAVTVLLAWAILGERLGGWQRVGFLLAVGGVALIASGAS